MISGEIGETGERWPPPVQSAPRGWRESASLWLELTWSRTAQTRKCAFYSTSSILSVVSINHDTASCRNEAEAACEASQSDPPPRSK